MHIRCIKARQNHTITIMITDAMIKSLGTTSGCLLVALVFCGSAQFAHGCTVCTAFPQKTIADYLVQSSCTVLAREDPQQPFHYRAVEVLSGRLADPQIDLFLDSTTRRVLATAAEKRVILCRDPDGQWHALGIADSDMIAVTRFIVAHAPDWQTDQGAQRRGEYFASLLDHPSSAIHELA